MLGRYRADAVAFEPGQVVDVADGEGERLLRDSPGTFAVSDAAGAMSTEDLTGIVAPDRRARGGRTR